MAVCGIYSQKPGFKKIMIKGGNYPCFDCVRAAGFHPVTWVGNMKTSLREVQAWIDGSEPLDFSDMIVTQSIGNIFMAEERHGLWYAQDQFGLHKGAVHRFEDIVDYEPSGRRCPPCSVN